MKYPITPDYLDSVPDPLVDMYTDLEEKILKDICRRFKMSGEATESAIAQMKILQERGVSLDDIEKFIRETLKLSEKELDEIIDRAVDRNRQYYDRLIEKADILNAEFRGLDREIEAIRRQTHDDLFNLTRSMGFAIRTGREVEFLPVAKTYQKVLDDAAAQVLSGAVDYNTAIREAVKRLTDSGLQTIDYVSGWHNRVDVAVRRAVMTGVSQLSSQYAEQAAEELETDLREVTAHSGARDTGTGWQNHKSWQGKVYSVKAGDKYPNIYEVCGWGMVDGLEGVNCRHHHYPFLEGVSERTYTDEQLANIDPPPFEYQDKTYSAYEATQKQRQIERAMRKSKREFIGYEAAGQTEDAQDSAIRLRRLSQEYKAFSKAAGLRTQPERARVDGFWRGEAARPSEATEPKKPPETPAKVVPLSRPTPESPPAPVIQTASAEMAKHYTDITGNWYPDAKPGSHKVKDLQEVTVKGVTYKVDGHHVKLNYSAHEKEIAELLEREVGGEIFMVPKVENPQGIRTPDYLFHGRAYDLKTLEKKTPGKNPIFNRVKKKKSQARCYIVDVTVPNLSKETITDQIEKTFWSQETQFVDEVIIVRDGKIEKVFERAKK